MHNRLSSVIGKYDINCEQIESIGALVQIELAKIEYSNASFTRKNMIITLSRLQNGLKVGENSKVVDDARLLDILIAI